MALSILSSFLFRYKNTPLQYVEIFFFLAVKIENFIGKILIVLIMFAQNIDWGHTLRGF